MLGRGVAVIVVKADAPWNTLKDFVEDAKKRPGKLKMGSTGPGGLPHTVGSMLNSVTKFQVISVPFDGEGPGITALMGGHVDIMPVGAGAATENIKAGRVKALAVVDAEPDAGRGRGDDSADHQGLPGVRQVPALGPVLRRVRQARHAGRRQGDAGQGVQDRRRQSAVRRR